MKIKSEISRLGAADRRGHGTPCVVFFLVCGLVIAFFAWAAQPSFRSLDHPRPQDSFYNLLVQGFCAGQLNLKTPVPPQLVQLADPFATNAVYPGDVYGMSYYKEKLYIYWGVTPALTLVWPYFTLTGHYLSDRGAVVIFFALGFLAMAWLLRAIGSCCFPEAGSGIIAGVILAMGLAVAALINLSFWCDVNEVAEVCGFAFSMLALAAVWHSLKEPEHPLKWLVCASLAYGLALGARPSLLYGAVILLTPVAQAWPARIGPGSRPRIGSLLAAALGPLTLVGLGLLLYNFLRFDSPSEFGWRYELQSAYRSDAACPFGLAYLWFNFRFYFLLAMHWCGHFPFLQLAPTPAAPAGNVGVGKSYGGILLLTPVVWLVLATPLAWRRAWGNAGSALRWILVALISLFAMGLLTMSLFFAVSSRYALEFLSPLLLVSLIGFLALECAPRGPEPWRRAVRPVGRLLLAASIVLNLLALIEAHAESDFFAGNYLARHGRWNEVLPYYQKALALEPGSAGYHYSIANALFQTGHADDAVVQYQRALEINPDFAEAQNNLAFTLLQVGQVDEAIRHFQRAVEITPTGEAYYNLGYAMRRKGRAAEAAVCFQKALDLQPQFPRAQINLAWMLATWPDPSVRNGGKAVALAEQANELAKNADPRTLRTLAAAYAETGRFPEAESSAKRALALAEAQTNAWLINVLPAEIKLYQSESPCRSTEN
ncbi:MAG: tetratricopeptide repeat protein [Verrucomicrobiota bacterium]|jgi:tetratricopeptide (TPR) repeat protein